MRTEENKINRVIWILHINTDFRETEFNFTYLYSS